MTRTAFYSLRLGPAQYSHPGVLSPQQETLATSMRRYWTNFVTNGNPSSSGVSTWPRFDGSTQNVLTLDTPASAVENDFATAHRCAFWAATK
jgi:para-nitrobenzyl esterase